MHEATAGRGASAPHAVGVDEETAHRARLIQAGQMLAGVVHEINNPLAVIQGYAQLLLERARDSEDRRDLGCILDEARRLGTLVEDMLAFTRRSGDEVGQVDLRRAVNAAINLTAHAMRQARVALVASLPERDVLVKGQQGAYVQVLLNLLTNARQSLEAGGRAEGRGISIRVERTRPGVTTMLVTNNGPPIEPALAERIFEPFFTTRSDGEGSGLGLALCREILARHGATIRLDAPHPDGGACFRVEFLEG
jgi:two-component system NtrC family sensor kinase